MREGGIRGREGMNDGGGVIFYSAPQYRLTPVQLGRIQRDDDDVSNIDIVAVGQVVNKKLIASLFDTICPQLRKRLNLVHVGS